MAQLTQSQLLEAIDSVSPSHATISMKDGNHTLSYRLTIPNFTSVGGPQLAVEYLQQLVPLMIGTVFTTPSSPRLSRVLPVCSPLYPSFYASSISNLRGIGQMQMVATNTFSKTTAQATPDGPQPMPYLAVYPQYYFDVDFSPRPYAALYDASVAVNEVTWWLPPTSSTNVNTGQPITSKLATEWVRFTEFDIVPQNENITGTVGRLKLNTTDPKGPIDAFAPGMAKILLPNQLLRMRWHQVPLSWYISANSYLRQYVGYLNQADWYTVGGSQLFPAGSLLYLGCNPEPYTSPVLQLQAWASGNFTDWKLCTMTLTFLVTSRISAQYNGSPDVPTPGNPNFITAGHNLLPWFQGNRLYYYTTLISKIRSGMTTITNVAPPWFSIPFDLLFTNPNKQQTPSIP